MSHPTGESLALGHLKDVSASGLSLDLPLCLQPGAKVKVKLSRMSPSGLLRHFQFIGTVRHAESSGQGCMHGIEFTDMSAAERLALTDYLCQVEYRSTS
jgi:hypothetical protein